eukprot:366456-Chlamydomonas_euryale.AAC.6
MLVRVPADGLVSGQCLPASKREPTLSCHVLTPFCTTPTPRSAASAPRYASPTHTHTSAALTHHNQPAPVPSLHVPHTRHLHPIWLLIATTQ